MSDEQGKPLEDVLRRLFTPEQLEEVRRDMRQLMATGQVNITHENIVISTDPSDDYLRDFITFVAPRIHWKRDKIIAAWREHRQGKANG